MSPGWRAAPLLVVLLAAALQPAAIAGAGLPETPEASESRHRTLFIAVDAVPFELLRDLTSRPGDRALFQGFKGPVPLISSFPSTTGVAFGGILAPFDLGASPGYEARFFDWSRMRVRGGGLLSYHRIEFPWRDFFDWNRTSIARRAFGSVLPVRSSIAWLEDALAAFERSDEAAFFLYIGATDTAAHLQGPEALAPFFAAMDRELREMRRRNPERPFETVIFSDHGIAGGEPLRNVWKAAKRSIRAAGYRPSKRLESPSDVVFTPFGLVSSFEVYVQAGEVARVADLLAAVPGVDLCVHRSEGGWRVVGSRGEAAVERRDGPGAVEWRYRPREGDPLVLLPILGRGEGGDGWHSDAWWFAATADHEYPDVLHRLARAFTLIENPASALCSLSGGYMFGARMTEAGARLTGGGLRWTHGALSRGATLGFLLSDAPYWQPPSSVRAEESLLPFAGALERRGVSVRFSPRPKQGSIERVPRQVRPAPPLRPRSRLSG